MNTVNNKKVNLIYLLLFFKFLIIITFYRTLLIMIHPFYCVKEFPDKPTLQDQKLLYFLLGGCHMVYPYAKKNLIVVSIINEA